ncbi:uncharacterized protein LOC124274255 isoform X2 [Haliotis rubra]|uniref:uncharacterized protein LOC124274255 isoform X2 n=1 Tax=Haliotis rubra TaxID=36100 RepID=UPI001EE58416|nr:uncharacterized protein LOC124274255 isoform X2 [Haliotis rubra]
MSITTWFRNEARVLNILSGNNDCFIHPPNYTDNTAGYRYDLYSSKGVSVSCTTFQHNLTLTTAKYLEARDVWRCRDQNFRSSNNLTSDFSGSVSESTPPLTDSSTTLGISTSKKTTPDTNTDNEGDIMYITAWTVGGSVFLVIIVVCVCVLRKKRKRKVTEDIDVSLGVVAAPVYDTLTHDASDDPCYTGIRMGDAGQSGTNVIDVYYNTVPNADYENPPLRT